jgi:hypothetical protein
MAWSAPFQITIALILLWHYLGGVACLVGLATMLLLIPINALLARKVNALQIEKFKYHDAIVNLTNEILKGMRTIKLNGWEVAFQNFVNKIREKELSVLLKLNIYNVVINISFKLASFLVSYSKAVFLSITKYNQIYV